MKNKSLIILAAIGFATTTAQAQTPSCANSMQALPKSDVNVPFRLSDPGIKTPIEWGLDLAWLDEANVRTGIFYAGKDIIDILRLSFQPTASVEGGSFSADQKKDIDRRITYAKNWCRKDVTYNINCDHKSLDEWYNEEAPNSTERAKRWAKLIDMTADYYKSKGLTNLVSISPLNEPDYDGHHLPTPSHRMEDFRAIVKLFKEDPELKEKYADVRMCGGNALNTDQAYRWWNYMKTYLDEGNTHQLAGSFDNYANFFKTVRNAGQHATNDELHNVMEGIVGAEYGMQTAIWWGTCEKTRSDFMKATYQGNPGDRLGYGEHRNNWTAASVYRHPNGRVQAFAGTSERQAATTTYEYQSLDEPVYFDGQRGVSYRLKVLGGTGYQKGQINYEMSLDIQNGEDVMPHIDGTYKIVNVKSGRVLGFTANPSTSQWTSLKQQGNNAKNPGYQQWIVKPTTLDGDQAYYIMQLNIAGTPLYPDILNWNYNAGADVGTYPGGLGSLEQWYLEYAGDGAFYIRSRYSTKCMEVLNGSTSAGADVRMAEVKGTDNQKWRFLAPDVKPDLTAPAAPANLQATPQNASVLLSWEAPADLDIKSYTILRSRDGEHYTTLMNDVRATEFIDNETSAGQTFYYKVYAEDHSLNRSETTACITAAPTDEQGLVYWSMLNDSTQADLSANANHAALGGTAVYNTLAGEKGLTLNGSTDFLQLPYTIANHQAMTISLWLYYQGGAAWQRIFDFGNGTDQYLFLTPNDGSRMKFAIKNGGEEQVIRPATTKKPATNKWTHIVVTIDGPVGVMYMNGEEIARNEQLTISPMDIRPVLNYIGRSQYANDPMLKGSLRDLRIYNYALSPEEVADVMTPVESIQESATTQHTPTYDLLGRPANANRKGLVIKDGKVVVK